MHQQRTALPMPPNWLMWGVALACILAVGDLPYGFYQFLRLIVTGYTAYLSYLYFRSGNSLVGWVLGFFALIYNPVFIIAMSKGAHAFFNILAAAAILAERFKFRRSLSKLDLSVSPHHLVEDDKHEHTEFTKFIAGEMKKVFFVLILVVFIAVITVKLAERTAAGETAFNPASYKEVSLN